MKQSFSSSAAGTVLSIRRALADPLTSEAVLCPNVSPARAASSWWSSVPQPLAASPQGLRHESSRADQSAAEALDLELPLARQAPVAPVPFVFPAAWRTVSPIGLGADCCGVRLLHPQLQAFCTCGLCLCHADPDVSRLGQLFGPKRHAFISERCAHPAAYRSLVLFSLVEGRVMVRLSLSRLAASRHAT